MSDVFEQAKGTEPSAETTETQPQVDNNEQQQAAPEVAVEYKGRKWQPDEILNKFENADSYIEQLRQENEKLKEAAQKGATLEEVMSRMETQQPQNMPTPEEPTKAPVEEVDIESVARSAFEKFQQEQQMQSNLQQSIGKLETAYGDKTSEVLKAKAAELDMSLDEAKQLASTKPKAFERMFLDAQEKQPVGTTTGNINTQTFSQQNPQQGKSLSKMNNKERIAYANQLAQKYING